ncbi:hypothetical protein LPN04_01800 [Rugamonas sp. A1-17]|nr:hypothetical protein [Rugamonas sp. A1-17]
MKTIDYSVIRHALAGLPSDHDAAGSLRPTVDEVFTPEQHANALDPNTPIVVGARGAGKSFWAGVLEDAATREVAAQAYPHLGLDRLIVKPGYTGFDSEDAVTPAMIKARVPEGAEEDVATDFWSAVIMRVAQSALRPEKPMATVSAVMQKFSDPENFSLEIKRIDKALEKENKILLVTFDALDTLSRDWKRSSLLIDALFEVIWSLRARKCIRAKLFIRPEQLDDDSLRFVELPKLRSGRVELEWSQTELYGLLFWRLLAALKNDKTGSFTKLTFSAGVTSTGITAKNRRNWALINDADAQKKVMTMFAGPYMGKNAKQGGTYDWPYKHLADAKGNVTPRSFIKLFVGAAQHVERPSQLVISAEGIRDGLRHASRVRVDQLVIEYQWIKRALVPLAGLIVPCQLDIIYQRWDDSKTVGTIMQASKDAVKGFLPPFPPKSKGDQNELLANAMERIGVFSYRADGRIDMPDLFRVAAKMLKKGGTSDKSKR